MEQREHPFSILLVDDDPDIRTMFGCRLKTDGFEVHYAADGAQALAAASRQPGLILLDLRMPGVGGLEVLRRLKGDDRTATVPVVMLSNESDAASVAASRAMGALAWWCKCEMVSARLGERIRELLGPGCPQRPPLDTHSGVSHQHATT